MIPCTGYSRGRPYIHGTNNEIVGRKYGKYDTDFEGVAFNPDGKTQFDGIVAATYDERFAPWLNFFDRKQIHVIDGDLLKKDPYQVLHDLETFLGVDHFVKENNFILTKPKDIFVKLDTPLEMAIELFVV